MNAIGTPRWDTLDPYAVPLCCGPRHGIFVAGHCATCGKVEQHEPEPPFGNDESRLMEGGDPGRSPQSECVHDFFAVKDGDLCMHCGLKLERGEPNVP